MKKLTAIVGFLLCVFSGSTATPFFPLMPWDVAPNDPAVFREMRECGLTMAGFVKPEALDACRAAGLKAIVHDPRLTTLNWTNLVESETRKNVASLVTQVGKHPAVFGYYLLDEPGADQFAGLAKVASLLRSQSPGKWPYINLFPNYAVDWQLATSNYPAYLELFATVCRPPILSYDHYAIMNGGSLRDGYWLNLEQLRDLGRKHQIPFWNIILSTAHYDYREPSDADFRFQVWSTLAYGGKGISYYTYFTPNQNPHPGALDPKGSRTPVWYRMQAVNRQVNQLASVLLELDSDEVYHFGPPPAGCHGPSTKSLVTSVNDSNFMVGDFTHRNGTRYVILVNKDFKEAHQCQPQFRASPRRIRLVSPQTGKLVKFEGENTLLAPGQGVLLKLEK